jgi:Subtilase family
MSWTPLQSRRLKIDWSTKFAQTIDPYIIWFDACDFVGLKPAFVRAALTGTGSPVEMRRDSVPVAFEIRMLPKQGSPEYGKLKELFWPTFVAKLGTRFATSFVPVNQLALFFDPFVQGYFPRMELSMPVPACQHTSEFADALATPDGTVEPAQVKGTPVFAAVIDDGCAFANDAFLKTPRSMPPKTRIQRLWFQEDRSSGSGSGGIGFKASDLNQLLAAATSSGRLDEAACYAALEERLRQTSEQVADEWRDQMRTGAAHGTHVLDTMAGNSNPLARYEFGAAEDAASSARIIFVQLPRAAVADTSGASMTVFVFEALTYISGIIGKNGRVVVNLSYGALAGPHDGTTLLEEALDHFLEVEEKRFLCLTLPAGNGYDSRTHAHLLAKSDALWHDMVFRLLPQDPTDTYVELWYAAGDTSPQSRGAATIDVEVIAPDGSCSGPVALDGLVEWTANGGLPNAAVMHVRHPTAGGGKKHLVLLALAPTGDTDLGERRAPHGVWTLRVRNRGGVPVPVDAWIERDDSPFGASRARGQATFLSAGLGPAPGHPHAASYPINRQSCLNSIAHGARTRVVAGCSLRPPKVAAYSASGPGRKGPTPGPDVTAPCELTPGSALQAAGTRSSQPAYMNGTSVAAAVFSRQCINAASAKGGGGLPTPDPKPLHPKPGDHPDGADPALRRGRGLLKPMP